MALASNNRGARLTESWPLPRSLDVDLTGQVMTVTSADGVIRSAPLPPQSELAWEGATRMRVDYAQRTLSLTLATGEILELNLGGANRDAPPAGVPVVYLDQSRWIDLARNSRTPHRLPVAEREAAERLTGLARSRSAVLPLSSAHLIELAPHGKHRRDVVIAMLELSRGWQVRSPLDIRKEELARAITGDDPTCPDVFTLEPGAIFGESSTWHASNEFPPPWREVLERVVNANAIVAAMLDDDSPDDITGGAERLRWLGGFSASVGRLQSLKPTRADSREFAHSLMLQDLQRETAEAAMSVGVSDSHLARWIEQDSASDYRRAPHIGTLEEVLYHRLRNVQDRWVENDLMDMHYLSVGAGYADLVVAEKKFGDLLTRAGRRHADNAQIATSLSEAVSMLDDLGVATAA